MAELPISAVDAGDEIKTLITKEGIDKLTSKNIRKHLQGKFGIDLSMHKAEIDRITLEKITELRELQQKKASAEKSAQSASKKRALSDDSDSEVEDMASKVKRRRSAPAKKAPAKKEKKAPKTETGAKRQTAFTRICVLSDELSSVLGKKYMRRSDVVKQMWAYFRSHDLLDPKDRRMVILDEPLKKIFNNKRIQAFGMMRGLKTHIKDAVFLDEETRRRVEADLEKESLNGTAGTSKDAKDKALPEADSDSSDDEKKVEPKVEVPDSVSVNQVATNGSASSPESNDDGPKEPPQSANNGNNKDGSSSSSGSDSSSSDSGSSSSDSSSDEE